MKRKKAIKRRGAGRSQGWGSVKKHRGAGNRGGRGNAGAKKQGKIKAWKKGKRLGKRGFKSLTQRKIMPGSKTINLRDMAKLEINGKEIDIKAMGYDKVLAAGEWTHAVTVRAPAFSARAKEKIEKAGGKAVTE